jgi:anti-sigma B factor antagonist
MPNFDVVLDTGRACPVVAVSGELDIATAPQLEETLERAAATPSPLVIDLTATSFCDSTGMTALLRAYKRADAAQTGLIIVCPPENREVMRVMTLLGFDEVLQLRDDLERAVEELCGAERTDQAQVDR